MRFTSAALVMMLALAGCQNLPGTPRVAPEALSPMPLHDSCGAAPYGSLVGQAGVALERVLILRQVRILRDMPAPAGPVRAERINFHLESLPRAADAPPTRHDSRIIAISCG